MSRNTATGAVRRKLPSRGVTGAALVVMVAIMLAGCGSSSSSSGSSSTSSGGTSPAQVSSAGSSSGVVAKATAALAKYEVAPTTLPLTTPLKAAPAAGKTFVWLKCALSQCTTITVGIQAAVQAVGWKLKIIPFDSADPGTLVSGLKEALQDNPVAVASAGIPEALWSSVIPAYKAAGVPLITGSIGGSVTLDSTYIANIMSDVDMAQHASAMADWFVSKAGASGQGLLLNVSGFPILNAFSADFQKDVATMCSGCKISELNASIAEVEGGSLGSVITSALRRDPAAKFFISCDGAFVGALPAALQSAGLTGITVGAMWGDVPSETLLKSGQFSALTTEGSHYLGAAMVDAAMRHSEGMAIPSASQYRVPFRLLTQATVGTPANSNDYPSNWLPQMKKLWKVG